jgi:type IV secretory pathway VirD2 relaxase
MAAMQRKAGARRVTVMARVVRHQGARFRAAPLARHIRYLERDGVTRDGRDASMFDASGDEADRDAFAARCEDDRHHFRLIVSPEDAAELGDLRRFTRDLVTDMAKDLETQLDWVAVDHWNTDNPHIHVLVRGVADDGADLVIDRGYIASGIRGRAEAIATLELGPRSELQIQTGLQREVDAERWTSLDMRLQSMVDETGGLIDLRPATGDDRQMHGLLIGRAAKLEAMGLAEQQAPGLWSLATGAETTLREVAARGDIIKTMHRALSRSGGRFDPSALALHEGVPERAIIGRLVERGLHDELAGNAYAIVDGADGRTHHIRFDDMEMTGDARPGAIVELRSWEDGRGRAHLSLAVRSDLPLGSQVTAPGATWLDRQLIARNPVAAGSGFGLEIRQAMDDRARFLIEQGLASRNGGRLSFTPGLIDKLALRELDAATVAIAERTGLTSRPSASGEYVSGIYRERVTLASGRFAMIDDGLGFQLVPWRPALDRHLGEHVTGTMSPGGSVDWALGRGIGI